MTLPDTVKRGVARILASDAVSSIARPLTRGVASILMLHRFADRARGNDGHDPEALRAHLAYLRRHRYELVSLEDLVQRLRTNDARLDKTVAFTIDDAYADYATAGEPVFAEFDCPATVFVVTGVTEQRGWYWWDLLRVAFETSPRRTVTIDVNDKPLPLEWSDKAGAARAARRLVDAMKLVPDVERRRIVTSAPSMLDIDVPANPPPQYASMTWDEIRTCARGITTFGAHTVSHPILARADDAVARYEIEQSWRALQAETDGVVSVFCYPNGGVGDIGTREAATLRDIGVEAAVTTIPGYATAERWSSTVDAPYRVPRFPYDGQFSGFAQVVNGVERMKLAIRGQAS